MTRRKLAAADCRTIAGDAKRVLRALEEATHGRVNTSDPIMEQLRQCPEAFKVGEILGRAFDSLKYAGDGETPKERYLPPAGQSFLPSFDRAAPRRHFPKAQGNSMAVLHEVG